MAMLTLAFALSAVTVQAADNCEKVAKFYKVGPHKFKADLAGKYCSDNTGTTTGGGCGDCCDAEPGNCYYLSSYASPKSKCPKATHFQNGNNNALAATADNFQTTCCTKLGSCSGYKCAAANMKDKADMSKIMCANDDGSDTKCDSVTCCQPDLTKCAGAKNPLIEAQSCGTERMYDVNNDAKAVMADYSDFDTVCCMVKPPAADRATCDITCPIGFKKHADYATQKCASTTCSATDDLQTCCQLASGTCVMLYYTAVKWKTTTIAASLTTCDAPKEFGFEAFLKIATASDTAILNAAAKADGSDFKANCCQKASTCQAFKGATTLSTTSPAQSVKIGTCMMFTLLLAFLAK